MEQQTLPDGYKQTEVGVIPDDWTIVSIDDVSTLIGDGIHSTPVYESNGAYYFVNGNNISKGKLRFTENTNRVSQVEYKNHKKKLSERTLFLSINGTIGNLAYYNNEPIILGKSAAFINISHDACLEYMFHALTCDSTQQRFEDGLTGSTIKNLGLRTIRETFIPFPKLKEQTAIANALSDVDALIVSIEKLIAKKQAIKAATMQQLLTGKKRLAPFDLYQKDGQDGTRKGQPKGTQQTELGEIPEDWDVINFGELFEINVSRKKIRLDSLVSFVGMQDVSENAKLVSPSLLRYEKVKSGFTYFERSDVLVAKITPCFENGKGCFAEHLPTPIGFGSTEFHVLRATTSSFAKYIYFITVTQKFRNELESEMVGSAGHRRVPFSALKNYQIPATRNKEEQIAIANILTDMDEEIQVFEKRLNKTQQIKQGMMQELLTGKIRLPFDKAETKGKGA
jgi:type I restriction enzyme S subunit